MAYAVGEQQRVALVRSLIAEPGADGLTPLQITGSVGPPLVRDMIGRGVAAGVLQRVDRRELRRSHRT